MLHEAGDDSESARGLVMDWGDDIDFDAIDASSDEEVAQYVATFHVFDTAASTERRAVLKYSPQLGLNQALSGYAPGREV